MSGEGEVVVVALRCARCGGDLGGLDADRAWACSPCRTAYEVEAGALAPRPYAALQPPAGAPGGERVFLPFWRLTVAATVESAGDEAARAAAERAFARGRAWVRAFSLSNAFYVGDPGLALTERDLEERFAEEGPLPPCSGVRLSSAEAERCARLFLLAIADRSADVTPVKVAMEVRERRLVAVPFSVCGPELTLLATGGKYYAGAFPDLEAARALRGE